MALLLSGLPAISPSPPPPSPTKTPFSRNTIINVIVRTPSLILRSPPPILLIPSAASSSSSSAAAAAQKYVYPDPIPEFAQAETQKFRTELFEKLSQDKETFGDDLDKVIDVCSEMFSDFLHKEYGGPGTLMVEPFTDMLISLKEKKLPGAPLAARASLLWAQNHVDMDWEVWNSNLSRQIDF